MGLYDILQTAGSATAVVEEAGSPSSAPRVEDLKLIKRTLSWKDHHPDHVITFASGGKKKVTDKIITLEGFPDKLSPQDVYYMAKKQGNKDAALAYAEYIFNSSPDVVAEIVKKYAGEKPLILPVTGAERMEEGVYRHNAIPEAFAVLLSQKTGWKIHGEGSANQVIQVTKAGRTGATKINRFVQQAYFEGDVTPNRNYIVIDDHVTNGGTLRNLMDYIEAHGGRVIGAAALIRGGQDNSLRPTEKTINRIRNIVGHHNFEALHQRLFGRPESEMLYTAGELSNIKVIFDEEYLPRLQKEHESANEALAALGKKGRPFPIGKELQNKFFDYLTTELNHVAQNRLQASHTFGDAAGALCPRTAASDGAGERKSPPIEPRRNEGLSYQDPQAPPRIGTQVAVVLPAGAAAHYTCH